MSSSHLDEIASYQRGKTDNLAEILTGSLGRYAAELLQDRVWLLSYERADHISEPEPKLSGGGPELDWKLPKPGCCCCTGAPGGCPSRGALPKMGPLPMIGLLAAAGWAGTADAACTTSSSHFKVRGQQLFRIATRQEGMQKSVLLEWPHHCDASTYYVARWQDSWSMKADSCTSEETILPQTGPMW